ncbi:hypothetical protein PHAVU_011G036600 [Phaseolus vulgaris]|uniref:Uncharacterized protein n=2 Tax=Phaseolus TaxID=3883 RepID=V7AEQ3_PHAVU|nr:hypothetical protein PHAVU_011G036600g [Phaseolus vulgaris]ESW03720.1 hypothetical protein PHAVU_011G036600g [Phaseolus vulgaris]
MPSPYIYTSLLFLLIPIPTKFNLILPSNIFITLISSHFGSYLPFSIMKTGNRFVGIANAKHKLQRTLSQRIKMASAVADVPKGHLAVYVGENHKRFVIPISYLSHPLFRDLLDWAEEEFGFNHPMGGLTIPCTEHYFITLTSSLN